MPKPNPRSVGEKQLLALKAAGIQSPILECRLAFQEVDTTIRYLNPMVGLERVYPSMLPTQASGRWSTKNPPLVNFSQDCINPECSLPKPHKKNRSEECWSLRDCIQPDHGWYFIHGDYDAIEGKLSAAFSDDTEDLKMFNQGLDIHTFTVCKMFGLALPPDLRDPHKSAVAGEWREQVEWGGKDDTRRGTAKAARYALAYGSDESAILRAKDVDKVGMTKEELIGAAVMYMRAKPNLVEFKRRSWGEMLQTKCARTEFGRRRMLFPTPGEYDAWKKGRVVKRRYVVGGKQYLLNEWRQLPGPAQREGLNHRHQGTVVDIVSQAIIEISQRWPESYLVLNAHDGITFAFPEEVEPGEDIKEIVEKTYEINGHSVNFSATWDRTYRAQAA